ncbi:cilia- and flagella- associated protein 210 [Eublepharis macularius]|uniref:Cilia- and flagella- associated protein 210 n=1 Tax=Eublepharis macularius TaxID=481883 RepID=A0AA97J043_EUBMA|nr:cilia- and flagella- associated protein 210 [Eublepharis macularius]
MAAAARRPAVQFGRRRGQSRESTQKNDFNEDDAIEGIFLPVGVDLRQITILSKAEWERIQDNLNAPAREAAQIRAERKERKDLHLQSQALMKNWSNTIAGLSQAKLKVKKERDEKSEEEKRKIDLEEAKYQAQKRKEAIEKAKIDQYYQSDRVKGFHRAFLLTEVLKEREAQIQFQKKKQKLYRSKDEEIERERQKAILKEEEKVKECRRKRIQLCKEQLEQIKEHEHLAELSRLESIKEGEEIQMLTRLHHQEQQEKEQKKQEEKLERKRAHQAHVADQVILRAIEKQKQEEEDDKVRAHFNAKQAMAKLRKQKEEEMLREIEENRENITKRLLAQMKEKIDTEDERIAREIAEAEEERERELTEKEEKKKADLKSITEHRINVMKTKEEKEKQEKREAKETLHKMIEADRVYQELEKDKKHRNHCANLKLQETHVIQIAEKLGRENREKQGELDYVKQREYIALCKEQEFQQYAKKVIDEESKTAPNLYPLLKVVQGGIGGGCGKLYRGREGESPGSQGAQQPYTGNTAQEMKLLNEHRYETTKGRLGFTW